MFNSIPIFDLIFLFLLKQVVVVVYVCVFHLGDVKRISGYVVWDREASWHRMSHATEDKRP